MNTVIKQPQTKTTVGNYFISNYPPFSCWTPQEIPKLVHALFTTPKPAPLGLYVHLPFCNQRCHYCYFRVYPRRNDEDVNLYVASVLKELSMYQCYPAIENRALNSVYFGGGSPSFLSLKQIGELLGGLQEQISWETVEECTFECDPGTVTPEKFQLLKRLGVMRLSLGFQSLNDDVLRRSGRETRVGDCLRAFHQAREAGFDEINIDLLAGLPGETTATWKRTIDQVLELIPDCITIYQLELTHNSALYASIKAGREVALPTWTAKCNWTDIAFKMCEGSGYTIGSGYMAIRNPQWWRFVYTVENFWHGADLLALGETSFGHIQGVHYQNADTFDRYTQMLGENHLPLRRALKLTPEHKLRREVILLLKTGALDVAYFRKKFGVELIDHFESEFEQLLKGNCVEVEGDQIRLTREALLRVDCLLPMFYLPEHVGIRYT
jgi:oxygen-independent coproporphyrinogen III oxidase